MSYFKSFFTLCLVLLLIVPNMSNAQSWQWQNLLPTGNPINCSDFVDSLTGWFGSSAGTILHTGDGGKTWEIQYTGLPDIWIMSIDFIDHLEGWAVGHPSGGYSHFLHTTDGGKTWQVKHIEQNSRGHFLVLYFLDQKYGWAGSNIGEILYTHDGGKSWDFGYSGNNNIQSIVFLDSLHGWAATAGEGIFKTINGGKTWLNINSFSEKIIRDIYFLDMQTGWLTSTDGIHRTIDGGLTWGKINDYYQVSNFEKFFVFFSPSNGWIGNFQTFDAGKTLIDLRKGYTPEDLKDIKFINKDIGWVVGRKGFIWKTIDGGSSWNHLESGTNRYLYGLFTLDENRVWIVGADGAILSTKNGGGNWNLQYVKTDSDHQAVTFSDSLKGWIVSENFNDGGHILHTDDGGKTWDEQTPGQIPRLFDVTFVDENTGWAISGGGSDLDVGAIYHTNDGGASWFLQYENRTHSLRPVYFLNETLGWAVGSQLILHTIDGGENWITQSEDESKFLRDIYFCDENTGWTIGLSGDLFYTQDGGTTWNKQYSGTTNTLFAIDFVDEDNGWIAGHNGSILHTSLGCATTVKNHFTGKRNLANIQLLQNRPNPFNQQTMISYELPSECFVKLKIYNILGKEVKTLVNKRQTSGHYKIVWHGKDEQGIDVVSGIYFYHIQVNSLINETGKMLLVR